jgi:hypothetical protein
LPDRPDRLVYVVPAQSNIAKICVDMKEKTKFLLSFEKSSFIFAPDPCGGKLKFCNNCALCQMFDQPKMKKGTVTGAFHSRS